MTATEKYLKMNHCFIELRDAIFESNVEEADEPKAVEDSILGALGILNNYLDYYKENNNIKTRQKDN